MTDLPWSLRATTAPLGIAGRVSDAKQIRDDGGITILHICPATGNAPTRMTRASWDRLCAATQLRQTLRLGRGWHDVRVLGTHPLVQRFVARPQRLDSAGVEAVEKALFALLDFLARKLAGQPVQPVGLFAQWRTLP